MRYAHRLVLIAIVTMAGSAFADITSYHLSHPLGWMFSSPVGETPGWSANRWFNFEASQGNVWNREATFTDLRNNNQYTYKADFEQSTLIANIGVAFAKHWSLSFEIPYADRNGGFLDDFIDQFHQFIRTERFFRDHNSMFDNDMVIQKNGQDLISGPQHGIHQIKSKLKWWFWQKKSRTVGACDCGAAFSLQAKIPLQNRSRGLTSGSNDYSGLLHLGLPFRSASGAWFTAALTKLGPNIFDTWPIRRWQQMYELSLNLAVSKTLSIILQARVESPLFEQKYLSFDYTYSTPISRTRERMSSGWHALTEWRGSQTAGLQWHWGKGSHVNFLILEDWGLGDRDDINAWNYVNNSPDVAFINQWHFTF